MLGARCSHRAYALHATPSCKAALIDSTISDRMSTPLGRGKSEPHGNLLPGALYLTPPDTPLATPDACAKGSGFEKLHLEPPLHGTVRTISDTGIPLSPSLALFEPARLSGDGSCGRSTDEPQSRTPANFDIADEEDGDLFDYMSGSKTKDCEGHGSAGFVLRPKAPDADDMLRGFRRPDAGENLFLARLSQITLISTGIGHSPSFTDSVPIECVKPACYRPGHLHHRIGPSLELIDATEDDSVAENLLLDEPRVSQQVRW
ncbi:hypothetical protein DFJ74DRAFT_677466 [Hyaloraphidium curvatum]|nr:hypothetical protein DFJ74DRAFT_677466 [Hyaloraphidium curvatum]